jgi:hypothetical protein
VTTAGPGCSGGGAKSRVADGANRVLASSATGCRWCDRPSTGPTDPQHAPCKAAEQRMDHDLAAQRQQATTDLLAAW